MRLTTYRRVANQIVRVFCKNIFAVIYCADHCVYRELGTPNWYLGGATIVGSTTEENFFYQINNDYMTTLYPRSDDKFFKKGRCCVVVLGRLHGSSPRYSAW